MLAGQRLIRTAAVRTSIRQRILAVLATLALAAFTVVGIAPTAQAATVDVACQGTTQISYSPGLLLQPQAVTYNEYDLYTNCTSSDPTVQTGITNLSATSHQLTCLEPLVGGTYHNPITWNNGQTSDILATFAINSSGGVLTAVGNGVVVGGEFQGDSVKFVLTYAQPDMAECLSPPGVTKEFGTATVSINGS